MAASAPPWRFASLWHLLGWICARAPTSRIASASARLVLDSSTFAIPMYCDSNVVASVARNRWRSWTTDTTAGPYSTAGCRSGANAPVLTRGTCPGKHRRPNAESRACSPSQADVKLNQLSRAEKQGPCNRYCVHSQLSSRGVAARCVATMSCARRPGSSRRTVPPAAPGASRMRFTRLHSQSFSFGCDVRTVVY